MSRTKWGAALLAGAAMGLGVVCSSATAADMPALPVKAPPPTTPFVLDVHGFMDVTFANNRVTGGGLLLYPSGSALSQTSMGLSLDIYKNSSGFINSVSVFGGVWNELWMDAPAGVRHWQEMDWWAGFSVGFAQHWKFTAQVLQFAFPWGLPTAENYVFTLAYNDAHWNLPFTINPYVCCSTTTVAVRPSCSARREDIYRVELGMSSDHRLQAHHRRSADAVRADLGRARPV